ncbi:MAG: hypothetical protein KIT36_08705 [Alphaproteobacteria bacterium]|nr:hypothetical protein [Alphaproteobacteria bacterium]
MDIDKNARLTPRGRAHMVTMVLREQTPQVVGAWTRLPFAAHRAHVMATATGKTAGTHAATSGGALFFRLYGTDDRLAPGLAEAATPGPLGFAGRPTG